MMRRVSMLLLSVCMLMLLTACGGKVIGKAYGAEYDRISIGGDTYTICANSEFHANDRGRKLGVVEPGGGNTDPMTVYSIKGVEDNEYIYVRWLYDGYIYKKDTKQ